METITLADYIQYGFMAFMSLLMIAMFVALLRQGRDIGEMRGDIKGIKQQIEDLKQQNAQTNARVGSLASRIDNVENSLSARIDNVENSLSARIDTMSERIDRLMEIVAAQVGGIGEIKGMLQDLHRKVDLLMHHRHLSDTGQVILTPEEVAAD